MNVQLEQISNSSECVYVMTLQRGEAGEYVRISERGRMASQLNGAVTPQAEYDCINDCMSQRLSSVKVMSAPGVFGSVV